VQSLVNATPDKHAREIRLAFDALRLTALGAPPNADVTSRYYAFVIEAIGELPLNALQAAEAVKIYARFIDRVPSSRAAMVGLASLFRRDARTTITAGALNRLRVLAQPRPKSHPDGEAPFVEALRVLQLMRHAETVIANAGAVYHCPALLLPDCWQVRYVAVQMLDPTSGRFFSVLDQALSDLSPEVRLAAVRTAAMAIPTTKTCTPLINALRDPIQHVVVQALDLLNPACEERDDLAERLRTWSNELSATTDVARWPLATHALLALLKFAPDEAKKFANDVAGKHEVWQVRAAAARIAGAVKDEALALRLMKDDAPNVRTEALLSLDEMKSPKRADAAVTSFDSKDYQLVFTAATQLKRVALGDLLANEVGPTLQHPLMAALARLTADDKDTSRDPRVELLARLGEYFDPADEVSLRALGEYLRDVDPVVAAAAADALGQITGVRPSPNPTRRPIDQPSEDTLYLGLMPPPGMTHETHVWLSDGSVIRFAMQTRDAPLTVYRFRKLADAGYYDGLTFHRVEPELLIQGGSPGANEYAGHSRFWRDEIGARHTAGSVALSTRGRHTGDAQFFINLQDAPQFDRKYTVFGSGCTPVNVLEGAIIARVVVFAPPTSHPACR